jgi:hypothetical protein
MVLDQKREMLMICDTVSGTGTHKLEWFFHLAPGIFPETASTNKVNYSVTSSHTLEAEVAPLQFGAPWRIGPLLMQAAAPEGVRLESKLESGWVAPQYGQREEAAVIHFKCEAKLPVSVAFKFLPEE